MTKAQRTDRKTQDRKGKLQRQAIWKKCGEATQLQRLQIDGKIPEVCVHFKHPLRKPWMSFVENMREWYRGPIRPH